jgi:2-keto-4-pentenoate hydratase/2-oxohepta-3-ene-1,7-dioic acid hydratase in catechol pathway
MHVALGGTFSSHQAEKDRTYRWPDFWTLPGAAVISGGDAVVLPPEVDAVNPGAELTAVIGTDIHRASEEETCDAIEGFTISNDVTATGDWPGWSDPDHPMITGVGYKCLATFSPIRRKVTPKRDRSHYQDLSVEVTVDGGDVGQRVDEPDGVQYPRNGVVRQQRHAASGERRCGTR